VPLSKDNKIINYNGSRFLFLFQSRVQQQMKKNGPIVIIIIITGGDVIVAVAYRLLCYHYNCVTRVVSVDRFIWCSGHREKNYYPHTLLTLLTHDIYLYLLITVCLIIFCSSGKSCRCRCYTVVIRCQRSYWNVHILDIKSGADQEVISGNKNLASTWIIRKSLFVLLVTFLSQF